MHPQSPSSSLSQDLEISSSLRRFDNSEGVLAHAQQQDVFEASRLHILCELLMRVLFGNLLFDNVEPAQPLGLIFPSPQAAIAIPQTLHCPARLPVGKRRFHRGSQLSGREVFIRLAVYPFCCVLFSTEASSLSKASANSFTPSSVSLSVTCFIEIPARARSSIVFFAPGISSVRLLRSLP